MPGELPDSPGIPAKQSEPFCVSAPELVAFLRGPFGNHMPSATTTKERDLVDFLRMSLTSFCPGESFQSLAF